MLLVYLLSQWSCRLQNFSFCCYCDWPYVLQLFDSDCTAITVAFYFAQIWSSIITEWWCRWLCLLTCNSEALYEWTQCCLLYPGKDSLIDWMWELLLCCSHPFHLHCRPPTPFLFFACTDASHISPSHLHFHMEDLERGWLHASYASLFN